jgi:hypothetical protein
VVDFTNRGDGSKGLLANFGQFSLGRRFLGLSERKTPMLIAVADVSHSAVTVKLPPTAHVAVPAPVDSKTPFGQYRALWKLEQGTLSLDEQFLIERGRIQPDQYAAFKAFAIAVDNAQSRRIPIVGAATSESPAPARQQAARPPAQPPVAHATGS